MNGASGRGNESRLGLSLPDCAVGGCSGRKRSDDGEDGCFSRSRSRGRAEEGPFGSQDIDLSLKETLGLSDLPLAVGRWRDVKDHHVEPRSACCCWNEEREEVASDGSRGRVPPSGDNGLGDGGSSFAQATWMDQ